MLFETKMQNHDHNEIERIIREAFAGVVLGEKGVGLWWGQVLDDYQMPASVAEYRINHEQTEERMDWSLIPNSDLNYCYDSLFFFDADGMRFHLPAFLIFDLRGEFNNDILATLCVGDDDYSKKQFSVLNTKQRMAVRTFLLFVQDDILCGGTQWCDFYLPHIEKALAEYWVKT